MLIQTLLATIGTQLKEFNSIPDERKNILNEMTGFIKDKIKAGQPVYLCFICTHNSRRSHIAQLWAQASAYYFKIPDVVCLSGGTEATAFNHRAVKAMQDVGFDIITSTEGSNPVYKARFADDALPVTTFSKKYDDPFNRAPDFAAVMTCSQADESCPTISGATVRIALPFDDPKVFDDSVLEQAKYHDKVLEIGREVLFAFSQVRL